jgi:chromosome segregation ATPase
VNIYEMTLQELRDYKEILTQTNQSQDEINRVSNRIAELELEEQGKAEELQVVTAEVAKFMDTLDFEGVDPQDLFLNYSADGAESSYNYVNAVIQNAVAKMKRTELTNKNALVAENDALQAKCDKLQQEKEELSHDLSVQNLEVSDLKARLTNATRLLDEEKAEVERLNSQVDDLRKEIAIGAASATKVEEVDLRSAHEKWLEQRQKEEDAKPIIYNIRWKDDTRRDAYEAELAETDETIEIPYFAMTGDIKNAPTAMKGKYRVVTSEEAPTFRNAYLESQEPQHNHEDMAQSSSVEDKPVTVPAFREEYGSESGLAEGTSSMVGSTVEERLEALELAVFGSVRDAA